jgi:hypothetical protein
MNNSNDFSGEMGIFLINCGNSHFNVIKYFIIRLQGRSSVKITLLIIYNALKICLWQNFEMAEITITPVQATQVKSVIICCLKGYGD